MHKPPKVIAGVGQKHPYTITGSDRSQITVLPCANAAGYCIPPMVVFDNKMLNPELAVGEVAGTFYGLSDSGWMDSELFEGWFKNHFIPHAPPVQPLLLMFDGHSSHYQPELLRITASPHNMFAVAIGWWHFWVFEKALGRRVSDVLQPGKGCYQTQHFQHFQFSLGAGNVNAECNS